MLTAQMVAYLVKLALLNAVKRVSLSPPPPAVPVGARDAQIFEGLRFRGKCYRFARRVDFASCFTPK